MSYKDTDRFFHHTTLEGKAWNVMAVICHYANMETGVAWPTQETLAKNAKCSVKTVQRAVKAAEAAGEIYVIPGTRRGNPTRYVVLVGLSGYERRRRLQRNGIQHLDNTYPPSGQQYTTDPDHQERQKITTGAVNSRQQVDFQMSGNRELERKREVEGAEREERETQLDTLSEFTAFLSRFYELTGKRPSVQSHREHVEPIAWELFEAGYRLPDLEIARQATAWMKAPPSPRQLALHIGDSRQWQSHDDKPSSQFGDQKGDYSAFFS